MKVNPAESPPIPSADEASDVQAIPTPSEIVVPAPMAATDTTIDPASTPAAPTPPPGPELVVRQPQNASGQSTYVQDPIHPPPGGVVPMQPHPSGNLAQQPRWGQPSMQQCPQQCPNQVAQLPPLPPPSLDKIMGLIMGEPSEFLSHWLSRWGIEWRRVIDHYDVDVSRNRAIREFLAADARRGKEYVLMIDADMAPDNRTDTILQAAGDLLCCGHAGAQGGIGHCGPNNFASACFRVSLRALTRMGQINNEVWFAMGKDDTRSQRLHCECAYFAATARRAGFMPQQVGIVGHIQTCILFPVNNRPDQWQLIWPAQFRNTVPGGAPALPGV